MFLAPYNFLGWGGEQRGLARGCSVCFAFVAILVGSSSKHKKIIPVTGTQVVTNFTGDLQPQEKRIVPQPII